MALVAWVDSTNSNYWPTDEGTGTATNNFRRTDNSTAVPDYIYYYNTPVDFKEKEDSELKRQLQLEISRAWPDTWWRKFSKTIPLNGIDKGQPGWKSVTPIFLVSPERVVSQRYGWQ